MFKEEREELQFDWKMLGDIGDGRPNLGPTMSVAVYRLMQFTLRDVLIREYGVAEADRIFFESGKKAGEEFCRHILSGCDDFSDMTVKLQEALRELKIGILRFERAEPENGSFTITVAEDLDCSGLPVSDETICTYDEGFLSGILGVYYGKSFDVREVDCWCMGDRICRFEAKERG
ncbi:MAG: 4-vinyl reductase [Lentisphaeria bacterium]|nr:4-vinyl reductase [Lentisphaeria bacterium]